MKRAVLSLLATGETHDTKKRDDWISEPQESLDLVKMNILLRNQEKDLY